MNKQRTIQICGKDVPILYCAATETGYERLSGKGIDVFLPTFKQNKKGETVIDQPPAATTEDYLQLSIAAIIAASEADGVEVPIDSKDLLYRASKPEVTALITAVIEQRNEWYGLSAVIPKDEQPADGDDKPKN